MKVIAINGSPRKDGNCARLLAEMKIVFNTEKIDFEVIEIGHKAIRGCTACTKCAEMTNETCVFANDGVNEAIQKMKQADGIVVASPVYFAGMSGTLKCFLDRVFYVSASNGNLFRHKVAASIVSLRRSGATATLDSINHYLTFCEMAVASSNYWTAGHGRTPGEVNEDKEGIQAVRLIAKNMAWLLQMKQATANSIPLPSAEQKEWTHFVR